MAPFIGEEKRRAPRYRLFAPLKLHDGSVGYIRDMSTCGVFFESKIAYPFGAPMHFTVLVNESTIECQGTVVRVEARDGEFVIAVQLERYEFS